VSQENVDIYFAAKDRLAAGDHDGFARLLHPDVTATVIGLPEPGPFVGRDAVLAQLERLGLEFDGQRYSDVEIVADRDGWIVLTYRWSVRGSRSGVDVDAPVTVAFRVKDSQLIEVHWRETLDDALQAAGLRE
jgi:ketosteroid isomerase-like protein